MILKGLKFGMLLQLAIGPVCLIVFNTSTAYGFIYGMHLVFAIALMDALYIALSCAGVAAVINSPGITAIIKLAGCFVLVLFGANTISGVFDLSFLPEITLFSHVSSQNLFVQGLLLTASNPLTIIFWSGMFSTQMLENKWDRTQIFFFAAGCVLSTLVFLTIVALLGSILCDYIPGLIIQILNVVVGMAIIFFGIRLLYKKDKNKTTAQ